VRRIPADPANGPGQSGRIWPVIPINHVEPCRNRRWVRSRRPRQRSHRTSASHRGAIPAQRRVEQGEAGDITWSAWCKAKLEYSYKDIQLLVQQAIPQIERSHYLATGQKKASRGTRPKAATPDAQRGRPSGTKSVAAEAKRQIRAHRCISRRISPPIRWDTAARLPDLVEPRCTVYPFKHIAEGAADRDQPSHVNHVVPNACGPIINHNVVKILR
jgi:hypothetical protein